MAADNSTPSSTSYFQKTVTLLDWWLTKPQTDQHTETLGVAGLTSQQNRPARCFSSAPILKTFDLFELETVDGVCVILRGFINKDRTLQNGFSPEVFEHFVMGFPPDWKKYCPTIESAAKCVTRVQEEDGKASIEGHDFHDKPQNCDSYIVDMGVQDTMLSNKNSIPLDPSSVEIPNEHIIKAGDEVLCGRSPVTSEVKDDPSLGRNPVVSNTADASTRSKCLEVSSWRVTRSMKKMDGGKNSFHLVNDISCLDKGTLTDPRILGSSEILNKKAVNVVYCDMASKNRKTNSKPSGRCGKGSNETASCSEDMVVKMESKRKQIDQNADVVITNDARHKDDADVSSELQIDTRTSDLEEKQITSDVNDDIVLERTNMKSCRNNKKNRVRIPPEEGAPATHGISSKEAVMTPNRSKTKLPVKRKLMTSPKSANSTPSRGKKVNLHGISSKEAVMIQSRSKANLPVKRKPITSPKSAKFTSTRGKKGSEEQYGSANILSIESFSGKKSRSGRVVLPPLEFWRNQKVIYDEDGEMCGVQEPK